MVLLNQKCIRVVLLVFLLQFLLYFSRFHHNNVVDNFAPATEGDWQQLQEITEYKFLVYSAYLDVRGHPKVVIIAVTRTLQSFLQPPQVWCRFYYEGASKTVAAYYEIIKEHWNLEYSGYYILCPVAGVPQNVSVVVNESMYQPSNSMKVIVNSQDGKQDVATRPTFAVCVKPMHYAYDEAMEFFEFIELHRLWGVTQFFLYNHSVGSQLNCILRNYQTTNVITILPWQLPIESQKQIRTEGIFAALNDCLYRAMHLYSHAIFVDFDEFIVPSKGGNYENLLKNLEKKSALIFRNGFFYRQWPDDPAITDPFEQKLVVLTKTRRRTHLHPHRTRSKYMVRPEMVDMVGNHFVWKYHDTKDFFNVDPEVAFLHHYRQCEFGGDDCVEEPSIVDRSVYQYRGELMDKVKLMYNELKTQCHLPEVD